MNAAATEKENLHPALTTLSEEEEQFRAAIREFAIGEVHPRVEEMEKKARLSKNKINFQRQSKKDRRPAERAF